MSTITLYHFEGCPACARAKAWINELRAEKPALKDVPVTLVDVHKTPDFKAPEPFYYVPTFFVDKKKVMEGTVTKEQIAQLMQAGIPS